jgi:hypothetical protein
MVLRVSDARYHGDLTREDRAAQALVVESDEVSHRPAAARKDDDVDVTHSLQASKPIDY